MTPKEAKELKKRVEKLEKETKAMMGIIVRHDLNKANDKVMSPYAVSITEELKLKGILR